MAPAPTRPAPRPRLLVPAPVPAVPDATDSDSFWGPSPIDVHPGEDGAVDPVPDDAVAPAELADAAAAFTASSDADIPDWYTKPVLSVDAPPRPTSQVRAVLSIAGQWWATRRRELLPGMVVASLVIVAFAVVLLSGGKGAGSSRVGTTRAVPIDPSTTIPGLFATAAAEAAPPPEDAPLDVDAPFDVDQAPVTTKPKASVAADTPPPSRPKSPPATSPPATSPPATQPPVTEPPVTTPPTTEPPVTTPPTTVSPPSPGDAARRVLPSG